MPPDPGQSAQIETAVFQKVTCDLRSKPCERCFSIGALLLVLFAPAQASELSAIPKQAQAERYLTQTFSSDFAAAEVDFSGTAGSGFKWYPWRFFSSSARLENIRINDDKSITLLGDVTGPNGQLATVSPATNTSRFVGIAFGGGGYFEATFKFDPDDVLKTNFKGWPAWWAMSAEHMLGLDGRQWKGQKAGYERFVEVDIFEYDLEDEVRRGRKNVYGGAVHDWYGPSNDRFKGLSLPRFAVTRPVPDDTDFREYHRYGLLWVPATASRKGYLEYYFDDRRVGRAIEWTQYENQAPPPRWPWGFSVIDRHHLVLILGTGVGQPMTIRSVKVWQASGNSNLRK